MDTTEELNGTYFYGGLSNLSAGQLFFWIMIDVTAEHFTGAKDVLAAAAVYAGDNAIPVRGKLSGAKPGTSIASKFARRLLQNYRLPFRLPTFIQDKSNPFIIRTHMTHKLGTFVGRTVPVVGWAILTVDVAQISYESMVRYNRIVRDGDKIW